MRDTQPDSASDDAEQSHEETALESSILRKVDLPPDTESAGASVPTGLPRRALVAIPVLFSLALIGTFVVTVRAQRLQAAFADFERVLVESTPEEALEIARGLPGAVRDDPKISARIAALQEEVDARAALREAGNFRKAFQRAATFEARAKVCEQAVRGKIEVSRALAEGARARFYLARRRATKGEQVEAALKQLKRELEGANAFGLDPPWAYLVQALLQRRHRGVDASLPDLRRAEQPGEVTALSALVEALLKEVVGRRAEALQLLHQALERDADLVDAYLARARILLVIRSPDRALKDLSTVRYLDPLNSEARFLLAEAKQLRGDRDAALGELNALLADDPNEAFGMGLRAYLQLTAGGTRGQLESARAEARRAIRLNTRADWGHLALAHDYLASQRYSLARSSIDLALKSRKRVEAYLLQARLLLERGDPGGAMRTLERSVLRLHPKHPEALLLGIRIRILNQQYRSAQVLVNRLEQVWAGKSETYYWKGVLARRRGRTVTAISAFSSAIAIDSKNPELFWQRARVNAEAERFTSALKDLDRAVALKVTVSAAEITLLRGHCHYGASEWAKAKQAYQRYLKQAVTSRHVALVRQRLQVIATQLGK